MFEALLYEIGGLGVRFPRVSLGFSVEFIHPAAILPLEVTQVVTEISTRGIYWGWGVKAAGTWG